MKQVINGKMYNTETAKKVGNHGTDNLSQNDFRYFDEDLYVKTTGEFFLAGEGHGMTKYARNNGNTSGYGYAIIPLELSEAKRWGEKHMTVVDYIATFGEVAE